MSAQRQLPIERRPMAHPGDLRDTFIVTIGVLHER
jgi:hypothetical protein